MKNTLIISTLALVLIGIGSSAITTPKELEEKQRIIRIENRIAARGRNDPVTVDLIGQVKGHEKSDFDDMQSSYSTNSTMNLLYILLSIYLWYYALSLSYPLQVLFAISVMQLMVDSIRLTTSVLPIITFNIIILLLVAQT